MRAITTSMARVRRMEEIDNPLKFNLLFRFNVVLFIYKCVCKAARLYTKGGHMTKNKYSQDVTPKIFTIRLFVTSLFMAIALGLYIAKIIGLPGLLLILFGAIWNFFVGFNSMAAFMLSIIVGILYGMMAFSEGLYINALLYTVFYIPLQFAVWLLYMDADDVRVQSSRRLSGSGIYYTVLIFIYAFTVCFIISIFQEREELNVADAMVSCLLGLSAYLQSLRYREYYTVRPLALVASTAMWIYVAVMHPNSPVAIAIVLLYIYYLVLDLTGLYKFIDNEEEQKRAKERNISHAETVERLEEYRQLEQKDLEEKDKASGSGEDKNRKIKA